MTTKEKVTQLTFDEIVNNMVDGKVVDILESYDRQILLQQTGLLLSLPLKKYYGRVR